MLQGETELMLLNIRGRLPEFVFGHTSGDAHHLHGFLSLRRVKPIDVAGLVREAQHLGQAFEMAQGRRNLGRLHPG